MAAIIRSFVAVLCISLFSSSAPASDVKPSEVVLDAYISMDSKGVVEKIEWPRMDPKSRPVTDRLEQAIRRWEFEPGSVDGVPAATRTGLKLWVGVGKNSQGELTLSILKANTGAVTDRMVFPRYPLEQAKSGNSATITLIMDVDSDGSVANIMVESFEARRQSAGSREDFEAASRAAAMQWKFTPESIAGRPIPSQVRVPFDFCVDERGWCSRRSTPKEEGGRPEMPSGMASALNSVVRIKSETAMTGI